MWLNYGITSTYERKCAENLFPNILAWKDWPPSPWACGPSLNPGCPGPITGPWGEVVLPPLPLSPWQLNKYQYKQDLGLSRMILDMVCDTFP